MKNNNNKAHSLRSLVKDIYDINKDSNNFESKYKELQRIDEILRANSDYDISKGILLENKEIYVEMLKKIISNDDIKYIIYKIGRKEILTKEENDKYIKLILENVSDGSIKEKVNELDAIAKKISKIESEVKNILNIIPNYFDVESTDLMNIILDEYESGIKELHKDIKNKCEELDVIDNERYNQKLLTTFSKYGEKKLKIKK